ncbi:MAG: hypothetical protein OJF51_004145 [Nitrospira sp.]|jgi:hypothetical protein|nr:MAG: hypothetical protein OJF51_004145 [Nitrospira sp.]
MNTKVKWTLMVYMAGDNGKIFDDGRQLMYDLQAFGWRNLADMTSVGSTDQVTVVAQYDTLKNQQFTPRFFIDGSKPCGKLVQKVPPVNTGDPKNLTDFIVWAASNYPAERYALVLWNHGTGWKEDDLYARYREKVEKAVKGGEIRAGTRGEKLLRKSLFLTTAGDIMAIENDETRGICYDDSSMDFLDNRKMVEALQNAETAIGQPISLLGMDACLMSMVEVAHQLRDCAEVMVGSQEVEPGEGWPYAAILRELVAKPDMSSRELGAHIVQEYGAFYMGLTRGGGGSITQSAIDLSTMKDLGVQMGKLARALTAHYEADFQVERAIGRALKRVQRFRDRDYMDLYNFLELLEAEYGGDDVLMAGIKGLRLSLKQSASGTPIIANVTGRVLPNAHGLSVYFPYEGCSKYYDDVEMAGMGWKDLICKQNQIAN